MTGQDDKPDEAEADGKENGENVSPGTTQDTEDDVLGHVSNDDPKVSSEVDTPTPNHPQLTATHTKRPTKRDISPDEVPHYRRRRSPLSPLSPANVQGAGDAEMLTEHRQKRLKRDK